MGKLMFIFVIFICSYVLTMEQQENPQEIENTSSISYHANFSDLATELKMIIAFFLSGSGISQRDVLNGTRELRNLSKVNKELHKLITSQSFINSLLIFKTRNLSNLQVVNIALWFAKTEALEWLKKRAQENAQIRLYINRYLVQLVSNSSTIINTAFMRKISKLEKKISIFLRAGGDLDARDIQRNTLLILACQLGDLDLAKWLLEKGANINAKNTFQETALITALDNTHQELAQLLIKHGADVNSTDIWDVTPIVIANIKTYDKIVKILREAGAEFKTMDINIFILREKCRCLNNRPRTFEQF